MFVHLKVGFGHHVGRAGLEDTTVRCNDDRRAGDVIVRTVFRGVLLRKAGRAINANAATAAAAAAAPRLGRGSANAASGWNNAEARWCGSWFASESPKRSPVAQEPASTYRAPDPSKRAKSRSLHRGIRRPARDALVLSRAQQPTLDGFGKTHPNVAVAKVPGERVEGQSEAVNTKHGELHRCTAKQPIRQTCHEACRDRARSRTGCPTG